jgi:hypothetical protein
MTALNVASIRRALAKLNEQPIRGDAMAWFCPFCDQVTLLKNMPCCTVTRAHFNEALDGQSN